MMMSRRPINPSRRVADGGAASLEASIRSKTGSPPYLTIGLVIVGAFLLIGYFYRDTGTFGSIKGISRVEGDFSCTVEVQKTIPFLKKAYGDSMHKVLHVGPDTCSVVARLLEEEDTQAWGIEPYDIEDAGHFCKKLVHKGIVRVADIKFPLPYRAKSFSLVIVSDALDYLSPRYLNRTLPELARVSSDGLVVFTGYPRHHKAKVADKSRFGGLAKLRSSTWWVRYFVQTSLEENEVAIKKFELAALKKSYVPSCQIFHLRSYR
ncbi:PREDICTED: uncharacterized protein At3g49720-like [Nicotiana attenuata]|uniref:Uncharacterized protein n=1 Tax=Nicotiana attenuata TaxID=49451 RepID=A0A314KLD2_NICAT|nr:PREDICTED: uncharacterized protein At3g49720-like [Nicotiana attenuata]XP_019229430.1 PREDICTED: uncharacterized protein At3g49720-like [Nicotiana attenuata]XP_019229431.1 PREDICTED: uncharacterized protein At3g49720-like [Nicotiana attenuata]OIT30093.1 uncharacterized protein A4A49_24458 [Nicotiana attenuata]